MSIAGWARGVKCVAGRPKAWHTRVARLLRRAMNRLESLDHYTIAHPSRREMARCGQTNRDTSFITMTSRPSVNPKLARNAIEPHSSNVSPRTTPVAGR